MLKNGLIIDFFAGGGGASVGIQMALGRDVDIAINHDPEAIRMHKTNHPDTLHLTEDIFDVDLTKYVRNRHVSLLWASPDCTSHSKAKGGKPRASGLRVLPWAVYKHVRNIKPDVIIMENVEEIQDWGPLDKDNRPIAHLKGECYKCFIEHMTNGEICSDGTCAGCNPDMWEHCQDCIVMKERYCESLNAVFDSKELIAADYGAPTTRKRWYAIFRIDGEPISWPKASHNKNGDNGLHKWVPVSSVLDFNDLGRSIFGRDKPLADNTLRRIAKGLRKFVFESDHPFVMEIDNSDTDNDICASANNRSEDILTPFLIQYHSEKSVDEVRGQLVTEPIKTIDTSNRYAAVMAFLTKFYRTGGGQPLDMPIHTITTSPGHFGLISVMAVKSEELIRSGIDEEIAQKCTWVSEFIMEYYGTGIGQTIKIPLHTIVTKDRFALVTVVGNGYALLDIYLRMLRPEELKLGQGFPADYIIDRDYLGKPYPISEQVKRIGNSVVPLMAEALVSANCRELKIGHRQPLPQNLYLNLREAV